MSRHELSLRVGYHGPELELQFVDSVIQHIHSAGYNGTIKLIGSRAEGKWLSTVNYSTYCESLSTQLYDYWYSKLNGMAKKQLLTAKDIPLLAEQLPPHTPTQILEFLKPLSGPASDFDLLIDYAIPGIRHVYADRMTGQGVDIKTVAELRLLEEE